MSGNLQGFSTAKELDLESPMVTYDPAMAEMIFTYCRHRLAEDPVSLDFTGAAPELEAALDGLLTAQGRDAAEVLDRYVTQLAPAVISVDSPRFLSFIPAAPTKATLLFDMVVSASSLNGTSWLEAAGAVAAENQVLHLLAETAGLPTGAGGVFISGGSIGNLSALVVARDQGRAKNPALVGRRLRVAVSDDAHSSVASSLRIIDVDPFFVPTIDHRFTVESLSAALAADPEPETIVAVIATAGTTNAGIVDDLEGIGAFARRRDLWFHVDAAYGGRRCSRPRDATSSPACTTPTPSSSIPTSGSSLRSTAPPSSTVSRHWRR